MANSALGMLTTTARVPRLHPQVRCMLDKDYIPNFKTAFDHFLVHTGGRAVIEEVEKKLRLDPAHVQPSKETLFRYGNTCCAAVFYVLTNMESRVRAPALALPPFLHAWSPWVRAAVSCFPFLHACMHACPLAPAERTAYVSFLHARNTLGSCREQPAGHHSLGPAGERLCSSQQISSRSCRVAGLAATTFQ